MCKQRSVSHLPTLPLHPLTNIHTCTQTLHQIMNSLLTLHTSYIEHMLPSCPHSPTHSHSRYTHSHFTHTHVHTHMYTHTRHTYTHVHTTHTILNILQNTYKNMRMHTYEHTHTHTLHTLHTHTHRGYL